MVYSAVMTKPAHVPEEACLTLVWLLLYHTAEHGEPLETLVKPKAAMSPL